MNTNSSFTLGKMLKVFVVIDVVFALMMAVVNGLILNQAGVAIGANGTATTVAAGGTFLTTFFSGLFVGAIFLFFTCILLGIWLFAYAKLTEKVDAKTKSTLNKLFGFVALAIAGWALLQSVTHVAVLVGIGSAPAIHASGAVLVIAGLFAGIITFAIAAWQGLVFFTVLGGFAFVILVLFSMGRGKGTGTTDGGTGTTDGGTDNSGPTTGVQK